MAEGGAPPENEQNPFSLQNFIENRQASAQNQERRDVDPDDLFSHISESDQVKVPLKREENPFSFRQFLKKDSVHKSSSPKTKRGSQSFPGGLPDFVQGHYVAEHPDGSPTVPLTPPVSLSVTDNDIFATGSSANAALGGPDSSGLRDPGSRVAGRTRSRGDPAPVEPSVKTKSPRRVAAGSGGSVTGTLPDFLSDGPMHGPGHIVGQRIDPSDLERAQLVKDLREENVQLRRELSQTRASLMAESQKVLDLEKQVENLCKKEADETKALENIVENVENNLQGAAKRAAIAENTIVKLKQAAGQLQSQVISLSKENESLRSANISIKEIKRKTTLTSNQIATAATTAEQQLRLLLNGVSSLKILAACLSNIDQLSEEDQNFTDNAD